MSEKSNRFTGGPAVLLPGQKRFKLIACEIFLRECCHLVAQCEHLVDVQFLRKGLHDAGKDVMRQTIQEQIDAVATQDFDAILLGYGRCNDGVAGLKARRVPLVIPRAHDCIAVFFGTRAAYDAYFEKHPGTYYRTTGWTERAAGGDDSVMAQLGLSRTYDEYVAKYGKENADFIMESMGSWEKNYKYLTYIDMGLPLDEPYARLAQQEAAEKDLAFQRVTGDMRWLRELLSGNWPADEFLVVPPADEITSDNDGQVLNCHKCII
jgi:hypothetical protein